MPTQPPGQLLKAWRKERKLSQLQAASLLDPKVSQGTWAAWESGRKPPSLGNALALQKLTRNTIKAAIWVPRPECESSPVLEDASLHARAAS